MRINRALIGKRMRVFAAAALLVIASPVLSTERDEFAVSLVRLLAAPDQFEKKFVWVIGYLDSGPNLHLYLTRDHARVFDYQSSIEVNDKSVGGTLTQSSCVGSFVRVKGEFGKLHGLLPAIVEVEEVENLDSQETCWSRSAAAPGGAGVSP